MKGRWLSTLILSCALHGGTTSASQTDPSQISTGQISTGQTSSGQSNLAMLLNIIGVVPQFSVMQEQVLEISQTHALRCGAQTPQGPIPSLNSESLTFDTLQAFNQSSPHTIDSLLQWFKSPLADKIHKAEKSGINYLELSKHTETLRKDKDRLDTIKRIVGYTRTIDFIVAVGTEIEYSGIIHSGCIEKAQRDLQQNKTPGRRNKERLLADATRSDTNITATLIGNDITFELAYLLRDLSDAELNAYEKFAKSDLAQQFYKILIPAVENSTRLASDRISLSHTHSALVF